MKDVLDLVDDKIVWGGRDITQAVKDELRSDLQASIARGMENQKQIAAWQNRRDERMIDGMGQHVLSIDEDMFHACRVLYGENCWSDPDFIKYVQKNFPEYRVKSKPKTGVILDGFGRGISQSEPEVISA